MMKKRTFRTFPAVQAAAVAFAAALLLLTQNAATAASTVAEWQAKAVQEFPALGEKGSPFNERFITLYKERQTSDAAFFQNAQWPLLLAREVAAELAPAPAVAAPAAADTPAPSAPSDQADQPSQPAASGVLEAEWEEEKPAASLGVELAKFRWWAPDGVKVRGVIVLAPGRGGDGRGMASDAKWQAIAREVDFGLVGCFLKNRADDPFAYQSDPDGATSALIIKAVDELLERNGQAIKDPPLAFYGHSAGANVAQRFANRHPNRMVAAVLMRCPNGPGKYSPQKGDVPLLIVVGGKDRKEWVESSLKNYETGSSKRAVWTLAHHPEEGHGLGTAWEVSATYLRTIIPQRVEKPLGSATGTPKITRLSRNSGWLGDRESRETGAANQFKGKKASATWLPNEEVAKAWKDHLGSPE